MRMTVAAGLVFLLAAMPAAAQDKPVDINFGFGWTFPSGDFGNSFDSGWNGTIGATYNVNEKIGIMADYTYNRMDGPQRTITVFPTPAGGGGQSALLESNHQMHVGTFDLLYKVQNHDRLVNGYVLGGLGIYHRIVQVTTPTVGYTTFCDPFWYVCYPALVSVDQIVGDRSSNDFGINIGGGITFGHEAKFYVESRYHYVWGKTISTPAGASSSACPNGCTTNASYFPITFGVRW